MVASLASRGFALCDSIRVCGDSPTARGGRQDLFVRHVANSGEILV
jgi:hypothetical protein